MSSRRSIWSFAAVVVAIVALAATDARAIRYQPRPAWSAGVGMGVGRGQFTNVPGSFFFLEDGERSEYERGVTPEIRFGRMLGNHFQVGLSYEGWLTEFGNIEPVGPDKWRRTMQTFSLAIAVFPGRPRGASGGIFLRAGAGIGWVGTGAKEVVQGEEQTEGEREDDTGWGAFGEGGYEFWTHQNATVGLSATFNYLDVSGDYFVSEAWFASLVINLNVYW